MQMLEPKAIADATSPESPTSSPLDLVIGGGHGDPLREVDVVLGHPFDDVFGVLVVAVAPTVDRPCDPCLQSAAW